LQCVIKYFLSSFRRPHSLVCLIMCYYSPQTMSMSTIRRASFTVPLGLDHTSTSAPGVFRVKTFNKISEVGLKNFPQSNFVASDKFEPTESVHAILLRSHKLSMSDVPISVRCVARCGSGTNNIPVSEMTEAGQFPTFLFSFNLIIHTY